ncbi:MAG: BREX-2 system adenine-specific DNA-methyltransferase PglX [Candidatus Eremiobacteraeota bacterium]|nr:BREX-2 system adenine-specific DNA-methyltransferase PglX [Candidatus Eremiobacteraeota bacterium]
MNSRVWAKRALEAVHGVDINPFAVAIARFRLVIAFVKACELSRLREMPNVKVRVATGDSLLHGNTICSAKGWGVQELSDWLPDAFAASDFEDASQILSQRYEAVVGNPPYITARDKAHNSEVRSRYRTAYMKYSLAVPFKEKFWDLAVEGKGKQRAGFVGMITANSFMKREFGSRVIEEFFPRVDLTHVIDTSGAYIPGHGTPTVILMGRNRAPVTETVRAVLGIRGEPSTPADPAQGLVWRSIVELLERPGESSAFVSVTEFDRTTFAEHPWSIGGGGASELKDRIEGNSPQRLTGICHEVGVLGMTNADEIFLLPKEVPNRLNLAEFFVPLALGDELRDYQYLGDTSVFLPYRDEELLSICDIEPVLPYLWSFRTILGSRVTFSRKTYFEEGLPWWKWHQIALYRLRTPLTIAFAFVATHNHFVLDRGGKVFNRSAPVIKLPNGTSEDAHLALIGILNSSVGNFWVRQVGFSKGGDYVGTEGARVIKTPWEDRLERDGSKLQNFPIPLNHQQTLTLASQLDQLAAEHSALEAAGFIHELPPGLWNLPEKQAQQRQVRQKMVALQEELDWLSYQLYGILDVSPIATDPPPLQLGERAFEIAMARSEEETTWFSRHGSTPITELPGHWAADYRATVEKRLELIANHPEVALLERPEHKRRWQQRPWEERLKDALTIWLQDRIESTLQKSDHLQSVQQLADQLAHDGDFQQVLQIYLGTNDFEAGESIQKLVQTQAVAYVAALRYSEAGLRIRADWERTWELQRREDAGENVGDIPVPPKFGQKDFLRPEYWSLRGKLDVPKERFICYPGAEREADGSVVLGWAGWNYLQRAQALAGYALERREQDGWEKDQLTPLLAGLAELLPWLKQWHNEVDPHSGERMGDYFESFLSEQLRELDLPSKDLSNWRPAQKGAARKTRKSPT